MKKCNKPGQAALVLLCVMSGGLCLSQNLVPNPSFEEYTECPNWVAEIDKAAPWTSATPGTPDYFHTCAMYLVQVPDNNFGYQWPVSGDGYAGVIARMPLQDGREYIIAPLDTTLTAGAGYEVSFYVSPADNWCRTIPFGALLTVDTPIANGTLVLDYEPQIEVRCSYLGSFLTWTKISGCYIANGGERYITIGNFRDNSESPIEPICPEGLDFAYYFIDSVSVVERPVSFTEIQIDPVTACGSYTIEPGGAEHYIWQDGTTCSTYFVTQSGTYAVTMSDACSFYTAEVDVTIIPDAPPVALPADDTLCVDDMIEIVLDPDAGEYLWQDGSTSNTYTITETGTYSVTLTDACDVTEDAISVFFHGPPEQFSLGEDTLICAGDVLTISLDPTLGNFTWYNFSSASSIDISEPGLYSLSITNMCGQVRDTIEVGLIYPPIFTLGSDSMDVCLGEPESVVLNPDLGTFEWSDGSTLNTYTITTEDMISVTVTNTCFAVTDTLLIDQYSPPLFSLGPDVTVCAEEFPLILDLSDVSFAESFYWSDSSSLPALTIGSEGVYGVTITNPCFWESDQISVTMIQDTLDVNLNGDQTLCPGDTLVLHAGGIPGDYIWFHSSDSVSAADTFLITEPGTYSILVTNSCGFGADTIVVMQDDSPPVVDLPESVPLCAGDTVVLDAGIAGVAYLWQDGSAESQFFATLPGIYYVQVSNACGTGRDTTIVLDSGPAPFVELGADTSMCAGDAIVLIPDFSNVESWLWQDGSAEPQNHATLPGIYYVLVSNQCGQAGDTIVVDALPDVPALDLGNDIALCPGASTTLSIDVQDVEILWSDNSTGTDFEVYEGGLIYATITNACGVSSDTIHVNILDPVPALNLGDDLSLCPGETITIDPGIPAVEYLWVDPEGAISTGSTIVLDSPGTVILTISNACGSSSDTIVILTDPNGPQVDLGPDILGCEGDSLVLEAGISGVEYLWQDGSGNSMFHVQSSGTYILQVSNACGMDSDTILVQIEGTEPAPTLGTDTTLCDGETLELISRADSLTSVQWSDGSEADHLFVSAPGVYWLTETNHCGTASDTIEVGFEVSPTPFDLGEDIVICPGDTVILQAPQTDDIILWETSQGGASTGSQHLETLPGSVVLTITNDCGVASDEVDIVFDPNEPEVAFDPVSLCEGESVILDVTQPFEADYLWINGATSSIFPVVEAGDYYVTIMTDCYFVEYSVEVKWSRDCNPLIYIPNVFSPNDDYVNDFWEVRIDPDLEFIGIECSIFDRWGSLVYSAASLPIVWDGGFRDEKVQPGVYVYVMTLETEDAGRQVFTGDLTLIR